MTTTFIMAVPLTAARRVAAAGQGRGRRRGAAARSDSEPAGRDSMRRPVSAEPECAAVVGLSGRAVAAARSGAVAKLERGAAAECAEDSAPVAKREPAEHSEGSAAAAKSAAAARPAQSAAVERWVTLAPAVVERSADSV